MKKIFSFAIALITVLGMSAQTDYFTPYQQTKLRLPSVPLVCNDPYISFWSPYDKLSEGTTRHWTGAEKAMDGVLRVDGTNYRFMGSARKTLLEAIAPMGNKGRWACKIKRSNPGSDWFKKDANESGWTNGYGSFGTKSEYDGVTTDWTNVSEYYIRRHITLTEEDLKEDLWIIYSHDDDYELYINGVKLAEYSRGDLWRQNVKVHLEGDSKNCLVAGDNVIAFHVNNTRGGALADVGLFRNKMGYHPGMVSIAPMADEGPWEARVRTSAISGTTWTRETFNDSTSLWKVQMGAWGTSDQPFVNTPWTSTGSDVYIRRYINLTAEDLQKDLFIIYSHDDVCEGYINGRKLFSTGETWVKNVKYRLTAEDKAVLHEGKNVIAYHVHNTTGGALADIGLYYNTANEEIAEQTHCHVLATNTYYTFTCGPVTLDVVFTAPMLMKDVDLMSTPINFISYQVTSNDEQEHDVQFYFATTPELTINNNMQPTTSTITTSGGTKYIKSGSQTQKVLGKAGDMICIDWGYLYIPNINGEVAIGERMSVEETFAATGKLPASTNINSTEESEMPLLAYTKDLGKVSKARSYMMIGYDEVKDIRYMDVDYKGYWARKGKTIFQAFQDLNSRYDQIMTDCQAQDKQIYDDALEAGNVKYAELLSGCYRHVIAAHKIFQDNKGNLLFFSKENNSNGCVNTVDLTYPSAPLFLIYNTDLMKGMCTSILDYCESSRWGFDFAAHDLGTYPHANGQVYSITRPDASGGFAGNMPIEESGNIVVLAAAISLIDGNLDWANRYWKTLKTWTDYLVENGLDPENQLCTDDFAGHLAHNANLSLKAIMGVAGFALMNQQKGDIDQYNYYIEKARNMATEWVTLAKDGTHYKLAFDRPGTWSQKYNMVWDKIWGTNLFPEIVYKQEMAFYATKINTYGLPLDNRSVYTKTDWTAWTACLGTQTQFATLMDRVYKFANETGSRVPLSDWYYTDGGGYVAFIARSVVGGHWMKVLLDQYTSGRLTGIQNVEAEKPSFILPGNYWYNLSGQKFTTEPTQPGIYIHQGRKVTKK